MAKKIKNILFDLGGVIMTICQPQAVERFREIGLKDAEQRLDPYTQSGIFGDLEDGKLSADGFIAEMSRMTGREQNFETCKYAWRGYTKEVPMRNIKALDRLRAEDYRLILISNTNPFMMDWAESTEFSGDGRSITQFFEALYMSYRMKTMKPDPKMFREILEKEDIKPEETLFVDDGEKNVAVGQSFGLNTMCPRNGEDWTEEIFRLLDRLNQVG